MRELRPLTPREERLARIMARLSTPGTRFLLKAAILTFGWLIFVPAYCIERLWQRWERRR